MTLIKERGSRAERVIVRRKRIVSTRPGRRKPRRTTKNSKREISVQAKLVVDIRRRPRLD